MTRDEIENLNGHELNRAIAEHIMGWIAWEEKRGEYTYVVFQRPGDREPYRKMRDWEAYMKRYRQIQYGEIDHSKHIVVGIKEWGTDISAAWEVVDKLDKEITILKYKTMAGWGYWCRINGYDATRFDEIVAQGETAPLALCRAALLAVLV